MKRVVLATANRGKLAEFVELFRDTDLSIIPQSDLQIPEAEETGLTFVENAIIKARHAARLSGLPAVADDSGLQVDALQGAPGIRSARFAAANANDLQNNALLLERLAGVAPEHRGARFRCLLVAMCNAEDPAPLICEGVWEGRILMRPAGNNGFGYDPLFQAVGHDGSAAQLSPTEKSRLSHRGKAMSLLRAALPNWMPKAGVPWV